MILANKQTSLSNNLISYYKFNDDLNDEISGHTGSHTGSGTFEMGRVNSCFDFGTGNDFITLPDSTDWQFTGDFAIGFYFYARAVGNYITLVDGGYISGAGILIELQPTPTHMLVYLNRTHMNGFSSFAPILQNTWNHVVVQRVGSNIELYVNNVFCNIGTSPFSGTINNSSILLGKYAGGENLNGKMDELGIWNRSLTLSEIAVISGGATYPFRTIAINGNKILK